MFTYNKMHTLIKVCAFDYFFKILEKEKMSCCCFLIIKCRSYAKIQGFGVYSSQLDGFEITCS